MKNKNFAVFILTHGRPDNVITYKTIRKAGYTGDIYIIIDNEDKTAEQYYKNFGRESVIMFDKAEIAKTFDEADNFDDRRAIVYARNACFDIAKELGLTHFLQLDDDYTGFEYRITGGNGYPKHKFTIKSNLDIIIDWMVSYLKAIKAASIAFAQGGDFIGGVAGMSSYKIKRKCMNSFFCSTDNRFYFQGRMNEDVNIYTLLGGQGNLFLTIPFVMLRQKATQTNTGGMTDIYLNSGTYIKSFYTVMFSPSCCKVGMMSTTHSRLHHRIRWDNAVPVLISEEHKKAA